MEQIASLLDIGFLLVCAMILVDIVRGACSIITYEPSAHATHKPLISWAAFLIFASQMVSMMYLVKLIAGSDLPLGYLLLVILVCLIGRQVRLNNGNVSHALQSVAQWNT